MTFRAKPSEREEVAWVLGWDTSMLTDVASVPSESVGLIVLCSIIPLTLSEYVDPSLTLVNTSIHFYLLANSFFAF